METFKNKKQKTN